jgi:hypothetical protein
MIQAVSLEVPRAPADARAPFDARHVASAPLRAGVYLLYGGHRLIHIGIAAPGTTIRGELLRHLRGANAGTRAATDFDCEASADPLALYQHYLAVYLDATGGVLPECHEARL